MASSTDNHIYSGKDQPPPPTYANASTLESQSQSQDHWMSQNINAASLPPTYQPDNLRKPGEPARFDTPAAAGPPAKKKWSWDNKKTRKKTYWLIFTIVLVSVCILIGTLWGLRVFY